MKLNKDREIKIETSSTYEKEIESEDISFYELSVVSNEEKIHIVLKLIIHIF